MTLLQIKERTKLYLTSTGLYYIPHDWFSEKLGDIIEDLQSGFASGLRDDNGIVQLRMNNVSDDGRLNFEELLKVPVPSDIENFHLRRDDIIFNNTNSLDLIGKTAIVNEAMDYTFSNHLTRIRVNKKVILPYWPYLILLRYKERAVFRAICNTHVGQSGIGKKELRNLPIFFPSVQKQQKVTSILSKVDELIQKTDQVIEQTQRLKKGLVQRLLTKGIGHTRFKKTTIGEIPESWELVLSRNLISFITSGSRDWAKYYSQSGPIMIRIANLDHESIIPDFTNTQRVSLPSGIEGIRTCVKSNDILISITADIGMVAVIPDPVPEAYVNQHIALVRPIVGINSKYIAQYLSWNGGGLRQFRQMQGGVTKVGLNLDDIKNICIPLPSKNEQQKIVSILDFTQLMISNNYYYKEKLSDLKKGLMQKLLTGKIRVKV